MAIVKAVALMLILGGALGAVLAFASIKFAVEEDHRVEDVLAMLPGYNCGGCGNPGCSGMAQKLVDGEDTPDNCKPCKPDQREKIRAYLAEHANA